MKKIFTLLLSMCSLAATAQYVGINTTTPKANLHVVGAATNTTIADGVVTPRLTRAQLIAKTAYDSDQIGAVVYVSDLSGATNAATVNVLTVGHYYFDGTTWNTFVTSKSKLYGFHASKNTSNHIPAGGGTAILTGWTLEHFDSNNWFDHTNGRFMPNLPGYYRVNFDVSMFYGSSRLRHAFLWKNNAVIAYSNVENAGIAFCAGSVVVYMNGTGDFLDLRHYSTAFQDAGSSHAQTNFQAFYIGE